MKKSTFLPLALGLTAASLALFSCEKTKCGPGNTGDCICTMEYAPVCGSDNKTYGNACEAGCNGIKNYTLGECAAE